jgi:alkylhydroperoxidase family enzyme
MPVIDLTEIDESSEAYALASDFYHGVLGGDYIPNGVLSHMVVPEIAKAALNMLLAAMARETRVPAPLKMLIGHMTSGIVGCTYCQTNTFDGTRNVLGGDEKVLAVWDYRTSPLFDEAERAALDFALAASATPSAVTDKDRARLREHWDQAQCAEIMATIAVFSYYQKWNDANGTLLELNIIALADTHLAEQPELDRVRYDELRTASQPAFDA